MQREPKVYIIILNYKNWHDVVDCLESVFRLNYQNFTVMVVDNHSQNDSLGYLKKWAETDSVFTAPFIPDTVPNLKKPIAYQYYDAKQLDSRNTDLNELPRLVFIQNDKNHGFADGNNLALQLLLNEDAWIWLLNPDMMVDENALSELVNCSQRLVSKTIIGTVIKSYAPPHKTLLYGGGKINFNSATVNLIQELSDTAMLDYISGGSLFAHSSYFKDIGLLPEHYFLYWEETEWCYRAVKKGYALQICETAICYDKISTTIGKGFLADYYYTRNGLLFLSKNKKRKLPVALAFVIARFMKRVLTGKWKRAGGVYKGTMHFLLKKKHEAK